MQQDLNVLTLMIARRNRNKPTYLPKVVTITPSKDINMNDIAVVVLFIVFIRVITFILAFLERRYDESDGRDR